MRKILALTMAAAALAGAPAWADDLKVAVVGPITGQYAAFGEQMRRGAELAVKDINAKGGVMGRRLALRGRRRCLRSQAGGDGRQPDGQ